MSQELIREIDHLRADIQEWQKLNDDCLKEIHQLKDQLKDVTATELKLGELQAKVEAAKTITKEWCKQCGEIDFGSDDLCQCDCGIFDLKKVLGETTK